MPRLALSALAFAVLLVSSPTPSAFAGSLRADQDTTSCDCSNCSAEHCQPPSSGGGGGLPMESLSLNYTKIEFNTQTTRDERRLSD